jgi:hypothetical protein
MTNGNKSKKKHTATASSLDKQRIFIQIPAYRDSELGPTLIDLYAKADRPEALRTAVIWQLGPRDILDHRVDTLPNLEIIRVPYEKSLGCNWARSLLQKKWSDEPFTMLLDSHHRFVKGWDSILINMHMALLANGVRKPLLTSYLPDYDPENDPEMRHKTPYAIYPLSREKGVLVRLTSYPVPYWRQQHRPVPASFLSLHFVFVAGSFNREVLFDPEIYFFGDEVMTGLKAFTWGYDLYHPHRIVGWHCFNRATRVPHWDDHDNWTSLHEQSLNKMKNIYRGKLTKGAGLGSSRTIMDYENHILMDLVADKS